MSLRIGVVADVRRGDMGERLSTAVEADCLSLDEAARGCTWNHRQVWQLHAQEPADWNLVLEDDAVPVDGFRDQALAALAVAPTPIVSFYLGRGYIEDRYIEATLARLDVQRANWLVTNGRILHAVALAVRGELLPSLTASLPKDNTRPIDRALSLWARREGHRVSYSIPSLVDHDDGKSLVTRYTRAPRKAWRFGTREEWRDKMMVMI